MSLRPHFTPDITLGNLLTAVTLVITITSAGIGGVWSMQSQMLQLRADFTVQLAQHELRLRVTEDSTKLDRAEQLAYRAEMRRSLEKLSDLLVDQLRSHPKGG